MPPEEKNPELNVLLYFIFRQCQPIHLELNEKGNYVCEYKASWRILECIFRICISAVYYTSLSATDMNYICSPRGASIQMKYHFN